MFDISASQYALATAAGILLSIVVGAAWAFIAFPFMSFLLPIGVGYMIGEVISRVVNRKRSVGLQVITGVSIFGAYVLSRLVPYVANGMASRGSSLGVTTLFQLSAMIIVNTFTQPYLLLLLGLGVFIGVTRVR